MIILPDDNLPPGFVPTGSYTPPLPPISPGPPVQTLSPMSTFGANLKLPDSFISPPIPNAPPAPQLNNSTTDPVIILPDDNLPPGFVPTGSETDNGQISSRRSRKGKRGDLNRRLGPADSDDDDDDAGSSAGGSPTDRETNSPGRSVPGMPVIPPSAEAPLISKTQK